MGQLEDMTVFVRVVDAGSITRAAEQLGMAKSAVSRRLSELEARLGTSLMTRTTRRSTLTDAGRRYYQQALRLIDDIAELNASVSSTTGKLAGTLRLAAPLSFGLAHLAPAIDAFVSQYPELDIDIHFSDRQIDLVQEGMDLAFRIAELKDSRLRARRITRIRMVLCASPGYLAEHGEPHTVDDLPRHRLLRYESSGSMTPWQLVDPMGHTHTLNPEARIMANNGDFLRDMAIAGHGIMLSPTFIAWEALTRGELIPVLRDYTIPALDAWAVYPQTRYLPLRARRLIDFLLERFGDHPYWDRSLQDTRPSH